MFDFCLFDDVSCLLIGPGAVQLGYIDCEVVVNPTRRQLRDSSLNMVVVATENKKVGQ